jgi:hypothetical protein
MSRRAVVLAIAFLTFLSCSLLTGCGMGPVAPPAAATGASFSGTIHGGQQPITGASVYLLAANTTGYGSASSSLLNSNAVNVDGNGHYYVKTDNNGEFTISGDYTCQPNQQVYVYAIGGNPGVVSTVGNPYAGLLADLGSCPQDGSFSSGLFIEVNEVTTVAAAYAMAGYALDATHVSSSGTPLATTGVANAFANAATLVDISNGTAFQTIAASSATVPAATIYTLADILATCINSAATTDTNGNPVPSADCETLLSLASSDGTINGTSATDTATAAINIAHHPGANIPALYILAGDQPPFAQTLPSQPNDFTLGLHFRGGGLIATDSMAIDGNGNAWFLNFGNPSSVTEISSSGTFVSGDKGYSLDPGISYGIAIDSSNNAWVSNYNANEIFKLSGSGTKATTYATNAAGPAGIAINGSSAIWAANEGTSGGSGQRDNFYSTTISSGAVTPYLTGSLPYPMYVAIDGAGNVWGATVTGSFSDNSNAISVIQGANAGNTFSIQTPGAGADYLAGIAIDHAGNAWISHYDDLSAAGSVFAITPSGALLPGEPSTGFISNTYGPSGMSIDGSGNAWFTGNSGVMEINSLGAVLSTTTGTTAGGTAYLGGSINSPSYAGVDGSGDVWVVNSGDNSVTELIGAATPVVTPIATGVANNTLGQTP